MTPSTGPDPRRPAPASRPHTHRVGSIVLTALMIVMLALAGIVVVIPRVIGAVPLTVLTGSMRPTIQPGDLVVSRPVAAGDLAPGDVVTFQPRSGDPMLVTHRLVSLVRDPDGDVVSLVTRGDANGTDDEPILPGQVMGRVLYTVPLVGYLTNNGTWAIGLGGLLGAGLVAHAVVILARPDTQDVHPHGNGTAQKEKTDAEVH